VKTRISILAILSLAILAAVILVAQRTELGVISFQHFAPLLLPSSQLARNLESNNTDLVRESLAILRKRMDPSGAERAVQLLKSPDDYVWLNAADYLGALGRAEAVPYLIKGLRHTAWRSDTERINDLQLITRQALGTNFVVWSNWWEQAHPGTNFDFDSALGPIPRR